MNSIAYNVAIVGATGLVGETLLQILSERHFPVGELRLFATARSAGAEISAFGKRIAVNAIQTDRADSDPATLEMFSGVDVAFFAAGDVVSRQLARPLAARGTLVIDKSPAFRLAPEVPLVVPEVNAGAAEGKKLIANPNCSTIPLAVALNLMHRTFGLRWLSVSTYQSVSGAGRDALSEYEQQLGGSQERHALPQRIAGNLFPEIGPFDESGYSEEERKIALELTKILDLEDVPISATTVRVPVAVGHAEAIAFQTKLPASRADVAASIAASPGVNFMDGPGYATPLDAAGRDDVFVGRLRCDHAHEGAFLAWVVCDNLRKGAATNAVQIAEHLLPRIARHLLPQNVKLPA